MRSVIQDALLSCKQLLQLVRVFFKYIHIPFKLPYNNTLVLGSTIHDSYYRHSHGSAFYASMTVRKNNTTTMSSMCYINYKSVIYYYLNTLTALVNTLCYQQSRCYCYRKNTHKHVYINIGS